MERHFLIPMTIAAGIHAGLLFGIPRAGRPPPPPPLPPEVIPLVPVLKDEVVVDPPTPDVIGSAKGGAGETLPRANELFRADDGIGFTIRPEIVPTRVSPGPVDHIGPGDIGIGGDGTGPRGMITSAMLDRVPNARVRVPPEYPAAARHEGRTGDVVVEFTVDEAGRVLNPHVVNSTDVVFEEAAVRAVARWRFDPGTVNGAIVRFRMAVPIVFRLGDD